MEYDDWRIALPRTAKALADARLSIIKETFAEEVGDLAADLATESCSDSGGWPDDAVVETSDVTVTKQRLTGMLVLYFVEVIPSSCKDMPYTESRERRLKETLERGDDEAAVEDAYSGSDPWDLSDYNSASDGT